MLFPELAMSGGSRQSQVDARFPRMYVCRGSITRNPSSAIPETYGLLRTTLLFPRGGHATRCCNSSTGQAEGDSHPLSFGSTSSPMTVCELLQGIATRSRGYKQSRASILFTISLTITFVSFASNHIVWPVKELHTVLETSGFP